MRILHLLGTLEDVGNGITNMVVNLSVAQAQSGNYVAVAGREGEFTRYLQQRGVQCITLDVGRTAFAHRASMGNAVAIVRQSMRNFDVIHAHQLAPTYLARRAKKDARNIVVSLHNYFEPVKSRAMHALANLSITVSQATVRKLRLRGRYVVVVNGIDPSFTQRHLGEFRLDMGGKPVVAFVGSLSRRKGADLALGALRYVLPEFPCTQLLMAGAGSLQPKLAMAIDRFGWTQNVVMLGRVRDIAGLFRMSDVVIIPSREDPSPLVIAEAMHAGKQIVASDVGGIPELIGRDGQWVLASPNASALGLRLVQLLEDPASKVRWQAYAAQRSQYLSAQRMAEETSAAYAAYLK